jgi:hypothetical protein
VREGRPMLPGLGEAVLSQRCCDWARLGAGQGTPRGIT